MVESFQCGHQHSNPDTDKLNLQWLYMMQPWKGTFKRQRRHTTNALGARIKLLTSLALGPPHPYRSFLCKTDCARREGKETESASLPLWENCHLKRKFRWFLAFLTGLTHLCGNSPGRKVIKARVEEASKAEQRPRAQEVEGLSIIIFSGDSLEVFFWGVLFYIHFYQGLRL